MRNTERYELAVCGFAAVKTLEKQNSHKIMRLYFSKDQAPKFGGLCKKMAASKRPYNQVQDEKELEKLCGSVHHQGVVAMIETPEILPLSRQIVGRWVQEKESALILDRVGNANNLGAIVRSAAFFGIHNIVIPLDESQSSVTTSSYRVAEGGMEFVSIYSIKSIPSLLADLEGKMLRAGTAPDARKSIRGISRMTRGQGAVVILGNEENGISSEVRRNCDVLLSIPGGNKNSPIESLNVAQAASIICYELSAQGGI